MFKKNSHADDKRSLEINMIIDNKLNKVLSDDTLSWGTTGLYCKLHHYCSIGQKATMDTLKAKHLEEDMAVALQELIDRGYVTKRGDYYEC